MFLNVESLHLELNALLVKREAFGRDLEWQNVVL